MTKRKLSLTVQNLRLRWRALHTINVSEEFGTEYSAVRNVNAITVNYQGTWKRPIQKS